MYDMWITICDICLDLQKYCATKTIQVMYYSIIFQKSKFLLFCRVWFIFELKIIASEKSPWLSSHNFSNALQWRHNERYGVSNHQQVDCLLNRLFKRRSKKTSKLRVTGLSEGNSLVTDEFPTQRASSAENASIWWRRHVFLMLGTRMRAVSQ